MHTDGKLHVFEKQFSDSSFHGTIHACRLKSAGEFQSPCQTKHQGLLSSEDHRAKLHLFLKACFFTEPSTTLITSLAHWQSQGGTIISYENTKGKENFFVLRPFQIVWIKSLKQKMQSIYCNAFLPLPLPLRKGLLKSWPSATSQLSLDTRCLVERREHSLDPFSVMST